MINVDSYLLETSSLAGWLSPADARLFAVIDAYQKATALSGDILEVGAFLGKTSVLLGHALDDTEKLTVIDTWEDPKPTDENAEEQLSYYRGIALQTFRSNYRRFHDRPPEIMQGLSPDQLPKLADGRYRLIHIDGSHEWKVVVQDVAHVHRLLKPGGIVAFDDMFTSHVPGVPAAVWPAIFQYQLIPIITSWKLFAAKAPFVPSQLEELCRLLTAQQNLRVIGVHNIGGHRAYRVQSTRDGGSLLPPRYRKFFPPAFLDSLLAQKGANVMKRMLARHITPAPSNHYRARDAATTSLPSAVTPE